MYHINNNENLLKKLTLLYKVMTVEEETEWEHMDFPLSASQPGITEFFMWAVWYEDRNLFEKQVVPPFSH